MRSLDVRDDLADGIGDGTGAMAGADGMLAFEPARLYEEPPPSLCSFGPCRHYHRMGVQLDAQSARPERVGGKLIEHPKAFHTQTSHYCYPEMGIEMTLGAMPVLECNRWTPVMGLLRRITGGRGRLERAHERAFEAWLAAKRAREAELDDAAGNLGGPVQLIVTFERDGSEPRTVGIPVYGDTRLEDVVRAAVRLTEIQLEQHTYVVSLATSSLEATIDNLDATLDELGVTRASDDGTEVPDVVFVHLTTLSKEPST